MWIESGVCCDRPWPLISGLSLAFLLSQPAQAQVTGLNGTTVTPVVPSDASGNTVLEISGGQTSGDGNNLFHSFQDFNLGQNVTADFQSDPAITNIFARIVGGNASYIDGLLEVSNGSSNLYFINPAGILTGVNARIELPGSFTATTSDRLGFESGLWDVLGNADVATLEGEPTRFQFSLPAAGAIVNEGSIRVGDAQSLRLIGGTVVNAGELSAPVGTVTVVAAGGDRTVNLEAGGAVSFSPNATGEAPLLTLQTLPNLLQGRSTRVQEASKVKVAADGKVQLEGALTTASNFITSGDVALGDYAGPPLEIVSQGQIQIGNVFGPDNDGVRGSIRLTAAGNIQAGKLRTINTGSDDPMAAPIRLKSGAAITVGDVLTQKSDNEITAQNGVSTGAIETGGLSNTNNNRVLVKSELGSVQVEFISAGSGGILVQAGQSFRALGTGKGARGGSNFIIDDPDLTDYLVSLGYERLEIEAADFQLSSRADVSLIARPARGNDIRNTGKEPLLDGFKAPIVIQYGDRQQTLVDRTVNFDRPPGNPDANLGRILIQGDSQQAFRMGLAYDAGASPYSYNNAPIPAQETINSPNVAAAFPDAFGFAIEEGRPLNYGTDEFPTDASGLVGGIAIGEGTDSSLYSALQDQTFDPPTPPSANGKDAATAAQRFGSAADENFCNAQETDAQRSAAANPVDQSETGELSDPDLCRERAEKLESPSNPLLRQIEPPTMPADVVPLVGRP